MKNYREQFQQVHLYEMLWIGIWIAVLVFILLSMNISIKHQGIVEETVWETMFKLL